MKYLIPLIVFFLLACSNIMPVERTSVPTSIILPEVNQQKRPLDSSHMAPSGSVGQYKNSPRNEKIEEQLYKAKIILNLPYESNINEVITAKLTALPDQAKDDIATINAGVKPRVHEEISISRIVNARLTAPDFVIDYLTPEEQAVSRVTPTTWQWRLTPKKSGSYIVNLSVMAVIKVDSQKFSEHHIKTFDQNLIITITNKQIFLLWLEKYWQWFFTTLVIPIGLWIYKKITSERSN